MRDHHANERLARAVAIGSPKLTKLLAEHIEDNDQVLPHVYFGDVSRHLVDLAVRLRQHPGEAADLRSELRAPLDLLEECCAHGTEDERELIAVSFLENLPRFGEPGGEIREMLGPHLRRELEIIESQARHSGGEFEP